MRNPSVRLALVLAAMLGATAALAQSNPLARQPQPAPQEGFFRPTPDGDPSLTKYRPPVPVRPVVRQAAAPAPSDASVMRGPDSNPASAVLAIEQARWMEDQLDRSVRESERDRARAAAAPPAVAGAFDGMTSEEDR